MQIVTLPAFTKDSVPSASGGLSTDLGWNSHFVSSDRASREPIMGSQVAGKTRRQLGNIGNSNKEACNDPQ